MKTHVKYLIAYLLLVALTFGAIFWKVDYDKKHDKRFHIQLTVLCDLEDGLAVYHRNKKEEYLNSNIIHKKCVGGLRDNVLNFRIPEYNPIIRIDYSGNNAQPRTLIREMTITRGQQEMKFKGKKLLAYFKPNQYLKSHRVEDGYVVLHPTSIDNIYDPFFKEVNLTKVFSKARKN